MIGRNLQKYMFHIVVFDKTNEVEVVPSVWIKNGECMWPPNKIDVAKAVKSQECPGDGWKPHTARIIFTSHDYNEARLKLPQAVDHTDLGSDGGESPIRFKRKRIRKNILFPGEDDDDDEMNSTLKVTKSRKRLDSLPNAPKIPLQTKTLALDPGKQNSPKLNPSGHSSPDPHPSGHSSPDPHPSGHSSPEPHLSRRSNATKFPSSWHTSTEIRPPRHISTAICTERHSSSKICTPRRSSEIRTPRNSSSESRTPRNSSSESRTPRNSSSESRTPRNSSSEIRTPRNSSSESRTPRNSSSEIRMPRNSSSESHKSRRSSEICTHTAPLVPSSHPNPYQTREPISGLQTSLLRNIVTNQQMMMEQLRIIFKTLQVMKSTDEAEIGLDLNLLPLKDVSSLQNLEERLQTSPDLQKQLVNTLALKGGTDIRECVWRIMHAMITNSLAKNMNMRGINGKIGFQRLQLRDIVVAAVRRNRLTCGATDQEIDCTIKRWLHLAPDRDGGRKERMKRKESAESVTG